MRGFKIYHLLAIRIPNSAFVHFEHVSGSITLVDALSIAHLPGCFGGGTQEFKIVKAPFMSPDPPKPATARPMINIGDDVAEPQIADPTSNTKRKAT